MSDFQTALKQLLSDEGGIFVPADNKRGASRYGITLETFREFYPDATAETIENLTPIEVEDFYQVAFWGRYRYGLILDQALATKLLDLGANIGGSTVVKLLQRALLLNDDGILGPITAAAANSNPTKTLVSFRIELEQYHRNVALANPEEAPYLAGWLARDAR